MNEDILIIWDVVEYLKVIEKAVNSLAHKRKIQYFEFGSTALPSARLYAWGKRQ